MFDRNKPLPGDVFKALTDDAPFARIRVDAVDSGRYLVRDLDEDGISPVTPLSDDELRAYYGEGTQVDYDGKPVKPGELRARAEAEREAAYIPLQKRPTPEQVFAESDRRVAADAKVPRA